MRIVLVSHFHWDREWYRTFEAYRGRLVDAVDRVLDLLDADPGYRFLLDGQTILLDDYLAVRPERRDALARGLGSGRLSAGPWYVQPDSLLPSGEAHVRNLLHGRQVGGALGPVSTVAYVPDSFGHPAQLPQLFAGFGLGPFVYWRGNGDEIDALGPAWRWVAPDGSAVDALLLAGGYFDAACLPDDAEAAARQLAERIAARPADVVLLMNGFDHMLPDAQAGAVADVLARATGARVVRGLLEDVAPPPGARPTFAGVLAGGRLANLLPGVWSTRMPVKLRNRRCETLLEAWAEPWAALGRHLGLPDERPALTLAWRTLLQNHAHDSICGCSLDAVDARVQARFDDVEGLATATVTRTLERLAGLGDERRTPWTAEQEIAVFNPSPHPRTDVVRVPLDPYPAMRLPLGAPEFPPLTFADGFTTGGRPVRVVPADDPTRARWLPGGEPLDVELVAADVPAFGWRRFRLTPAPVVPDAVDEERTIATAEVAVTVADDGTLTARLGGAEYRGLLGIEERGDRGDSYDFDPVADDPGATLASVSWRRHVHPSGIARLRVTRVFTVPRALDADRARRSAATTALVVHTEARIAPGVPRVDLSVRVENTARDHRLRLRFPTGRAVATHRAASTFDVAARTTAPVDAARWVHAAPTTFVHQGWIEAGGLTVVAPGLPEAEVTLDGTILVTLLRAIGWIARYDLHSRPIPAGPPMPLETAQLPGPLEARLALLPGVDPSAARDAEVELRGVLAGPAPVLPPDRSLLALAPASLLVSAVKPAEAGPGIVVRVLNPTDAPEIAVLSAGFTIGTAEAVRLDESGAPDAVTRDADTVRIVVPPRALRSVLLR